MIKKRVPATSSLSEREIEYVDLGNLHLDMENPRLPENLQRRDADVVRHITDSTSIEDLVNAIGQNDYFPGEPLVVVPHEARSGHFTVVEGNRRLTALRLLQDLRILKNPSARLKAVVEEAKYHPTKIPVVVCQARKDVLPYLGYRHITGVKQWEPLSKARYMRQMLDALTKKSSKPADRYREVAKTIGTRSDNIKRNLNALAVYECMDGNAFFRIPGLSEDSVKFGTLYTALADARIGAFVGTERKEGSEYKSNDAIFDRTAVKPDAVKDLAVWMFKQDAKGATTLGESRNIGKLAAVISDVSALKALKGGSTLDYAYRLTEGISEEFLAALYAAERELRSASSLLANLNGNVEQHQQVAKDVAQLALFISESLAVRRPRA